jgi:hypothetical protein
MVEQERSRGSFVLEVHSIKSQNQRNVRDEHDHEPARKVRGVMRIASSIKVSIIPSSPEFPSASPSVRKDVIIKGEDRASERRASVEMGDIKIPPEHLCSDSDNRTFDDSYLMMISVSFTDSIAAEELYAFMGLDTSDVPTFLSTSYGNILKCPPGRFILPLKAASRPLGIGLEVCMYWHGTSGDSILEKSNRHLKSSVQSPRSYPTPPLEAEPRFRLTFVYGNEKIERTKLICLHCTKPKTLASIQDLQMHLKAWHEYFDYEVINQSVDKNGVEHWLFKSEVADHKSAPNQRASEHADEPSDVRVVAPQQPFDRDKFLRGDNGYQQQARVEKNLKQAKTKVDVPATIVPKQRKHQNEVQARPQKSKKTYVIPKAPNGVTFFRSISKRPLKEGEEITESDDELDEDWMTLRKHAELDKEEFSESATRFLKIFDDFLHEERLHSDFHAGDAIVRFARQHGARLWKEELMHEFTEKLNELLEDNIISSELHLGALDIANTQKTTTDSFMKRLAELDVQHPLGHRADITPKPITDRKGKGKAIITETGNLTPITADSDGDVEMREVTMAETGTMARVQGEPPDPPFDQCYCGQDATASPGASGIVACNSVVSIIPLNYTIRIHY